MTTDSSRLQVIQEKEARYEEKKAEKEAEDEVESGSSTEDDQLSNIWEASEKHFCGVTVHKNTITCVQLSTIFVVLLLLGGGIFYAIEHPNEVKRIEKATIDYYQDKQAVVSILYNANFSGDMNKTLHLYEELQKHSLGFQKGPDDVNQWGFSKAVIFSFTIITTIGYGTFAPATIAGQMFLILYALIGIPVAGLSLGFIAERALYVFTVVSQIGKDKAGAAFRELDDDGSGELDQDEFREAVKAMGFELTALEFKKLWSEVDKDGGGSVDIDEFREAIKFMKADVTEAAGKKNKVVITVVGILSWVGVGVIFFSVMEQWRAEKSLYFVFVSLTTIGLGDFFPETSIGLAFLVVFAMVGLGLVAVLLTLVESVFAEAEALRKKKEQDAKEVVENMKKLRHIPPFTGLGDEDLESLAAKATKLEYASNIEFIREGENLDTAFVLTEGSVVVTSSQSNEKETITKKSLLLESTVMNNPKSHESTVSVRTLDVSEILSFHLDDLPFPLEKTVKSIKDNNDNPDDGEMRIHIAEVIDPFDVNLNSNVDSSSRTLSKAYGEAAFT